MSDFEEGSETDASSGIRTPAPQSEKEEGATISELSIRTTVRPLINRNDNLVWSQNSNQDDDDDIDEFFSTYDDEFTSVYLSNSTHQDSGVRDIIVTKPVDKEIKKDEEDKYMELLLKAFKFGFYGYLASLDSFRSVVDELKLVLKHKSAINQVEAMYQNYMTQYIKRRNIEKSVQEAVKAAPHQKEVPRTVSMSTFRRGMLLEDKQPKMTMCSLDYGMLIGAIAALSVQHGVTNFKVALDSVVVELVQFRMGLILCEQTGHRSMMEVSEFQPLKKKFLCHLIELLDLNQTVRVEDANGIKLTLESTSCNDKAITVEGHPDLLIFPVNATDVCVESCLGSNEVKPPLKGQPLTSGSGTLGVKRDQSVVQTAAIQSKNNKLRVHVTDDLFTAYMILSFTDSDSQESWYFTIPRTTDAREVCLLNILLLLPAYSVPWAAVLDADTASDAWQALMRVTDANKITTNSLKRKDPDDPNDSDNDDLSGGGGGAPREEKRNRSNAEKFSGGSSSSSSGSSSSSSGSSSSSSGSSASNAPKSALANSSFPKAKKNVKFVDINGAENFVNGTADVSGDKDVKPTASVGPMDI